jgi:hypothetical protein
MMMMGQIDNSIAPFQTSNCLQVFYSNTYLLFYALFMFISSSTLLQLITLL